MIALSFAWVLSAQQPVASQHFLPMTVGTYWIYRGTVRWFSFDLGRPAEKKVTLKMTLKKVASNEAISVALLGGFPGDVDWLQADDPIQPSQWVWIENKAHQVFLRELDGNKDAIFLDGRKSLLDIQYTADDLVFQWPLAKGKKFCEAEDRKRTDDRYCWVVATVANKTIDSIKGLAGKTKSVYLLQYVTNPEDYQMELLPGIGVLSYQYHHHGSIADTCLTLVEYHPAPALPLPGAPSHDTASQ
jgi:hypothetical protein